MKFIFSIFCINYTKLASRLRETFTENLDSQIGFSVEELLTSERDEPESAEELSGIFSLNSYCTSQSLTWFTLSTSAFKYFP